MSISGIDGINYTTFAGNRYGATMTNGYTAASNAVSQFETYQQKIGDYSLLAARADALSFAGNSLRSVIDQFQGSATNQAARGDQGPTLDAPQRDRLQWQVDNLVDQYNRTVLAAGPVNAASVNSTLNGVAVTPLAAAGITRNQDNTLAFNQDTFLAAVTAGTTTEGLNSTLAALGGFAMDSTKAAATVINEVQDLTAAATTQVGDLLQTAATEQLNQLVQNSLNNFAAIYNSIGNNLFGTNEYNSSLNQFNQWSSSDLNNISNSAANNLFSFFGSENSFNSIQLNQLMLNSLNAINQTVTSRLFASLGIGSNFNSVA